MFIYCAFFGLLIGTSYLMRQKNDLNGINHPLSAIGYSLLIINFESNLPQIHTRFKRPSGTSRGIMTEEETWFMYLKRR
jgi:hypothetical protein